MDIIQNDIERLAQKLEILEARMDIIHQQQIVLDERQRRENSSLTRAFLLSDQASAELKKEFEQDRKNGVAQDAKLVAVEMLLNAVRNSIKTAIYVIAGGFALVVILLFVIALR